MNVVHPKDFIGAIHSMPHNIAAAVVDKDFTWHHVSTEKINDPTIGILREKVRLKMDPRDPAVSSLGRSAVSMPKGAMTIRGGTVTITTKAAREYSSTVEWPKGSPPRGISWSDVDAKYRALLPMTMLPANKIEQSLQLIHELDSVKKVSDLTVLLRR